MNASASTIYKEEKSKEEQSATTKSEVYKQQIIWKNVAFISFLHVASLYGIYLALTSAKWSTIVFAYSLFIFSGLGITAGAHRLWSHKAYKATWQLQLMLIVANTIAFQDSIIHWCRDHRLHHKHSDTEADPHNAKRGFFYSHVGWLMYSKSPEVKSKGRALEMDDLLNNPLLAFQYKYYIILMPIFCFILPTIIPIYLWSETWRSSFFIAAILRYTFALNFTWLVNSAAHLFGSKPYDRNIYPSQNLLVTVATFGEGWHNYHHIFPWDYKAAELGSYGLTNGTTKVINFFAKIGWAYDLKSASESVVQKRVKRTGDGSHEIWGWGDSDQSAEERESATIYYAKQS